MSEDKLLNPDRLWNRTEVLTRPCPVPAEAGVYAWYFNELPSAEIDASACHQVEGATLLYVGISPKKPSSTGTPSKQSLRTRLRYHYRGNAYGSTLRLTLGCLLSERLGIDLQRVGNSGKRLTFADGEVKVSDWMGKNALVCWLPTGTPWELEETLIQTLNLPLNLDQNSRHPFHAFLTERRALCRAQALGRRIVNGRSDQVRQPMGAVEDQFEAAMTRLHREAKAIGYNGTYFARMLAQNGGVTTAKKLVNSEAPASGFVQLWERGRPDLTVEYLVADRSYRALFTTDEVLRARRRLQAYEA